MTTLSTPKRKSKNTLLLLLLLIIIACAIAGYVLFFEGERPTVEISSPENYLGKENTVTVTAHDQKSGIRQLIVSISQGENRKELYRHEVSRKGYTGLIGEAEVSVQIPFKPKDAGFSEGPAVLQVEAMDYSMRGLLKGNTTTTIKELIIDTAPPRISLLHSERYISPGGSGIVIYRLDDTSAMSGLSVNDHFHPGFVIGDGREDTFIAFFGLKYDAENLKGAHVQATDTAGNVTKLPFSVIFKDANFKHDRINVGNGFLELKIPEFEQHYPQMQGSLLDKYLYTNNEVRQQNNAAISELCRSPGPERLWDGRFLRMAGSTRSGYADHRTYYHGSAPIDKQVHLGIDIASTRQADVKAAARGTVIYADYLGIYGNLVLLDHGQGVFSLYSHLSQINVSPDDLVDQGSVLGLTGTTGMAGGDHLHFSMLVNGIFVTPKEWWDQHWIDVTIEDPITESRFQ